MTRNLLGVEKKLSSKTRRKKTSATHTFVCNLIINLKPRAREHLMCNTLDRSAIGADSVLWLIFAL